MTDTNTKVREHYNSLGLTDRLKAALATITLKAIVVVSIASLPVIGERVPQRHDAALTPLLV